VERPQARGQPLPGPPGRLLSDRDAVGDTPMVALTGADPSKCCGGPPTLLPCFAMWRRRILRGRALSTALSVSVSVSLLGAASALWLACSSSTPIDMYYGTDAGLGFDAPTPDGRGLGGSSGAGGSGGAGGLGGSAGAAGSDAGSDDGSAGTGGTAP
jgi:hypothetical protein